MSVVTFVFSSRILQFNSHGKKMNNVQLNSFFFFLNKKSMKYIHLYFAISTPKLAIFMITAE